MACLGILAASVAIVFFEARLLLKLKRKKDSLAFSLILLIATGLSIVEALHVRLPNPFDWLLLIFKPFNDWIDHL